MPRVKVTPTLPGHRRRVHDRVHRVIDLVNGPGLRAQLGPQTWAVSLPARG
jgi:hypothetical protein